MKKLSELDESVNINEQQEENVVEYDNPLNLPPIETLGDGSFEGALWCHCFVHDGKKYYSGMGTKNIYPYKCSVVIKNGEFERFDFTDKFQHPDLKKLFK